MLALPMGTEHYTATTEYCWKALQTGSDGQHSYGCVRKASVHACSLPGYITRSPALLLATFMSANQQIIPAGAGGGPAQQAAAHADERLRLTHVLPQPRRRVACAHPGRLARQAQPVSATGPPPSMSPSLPSELW